MIDEEFDEISDEDLSEIYDDFENTKFFNEHFDEISESMGEYFKIRNEGSMNPKRYFREVISLIQERISDSQRLCDSCNSPAPNTCTKEQVNLGIREGKLCAICGKWVCDNCIDKAFIHEIQTGYYICKKCVRKKSKKTILEFLKEYY